LCWLDAARQSSQTAVGGWLKATAFVGAFPVLSIFGHLLGRQLMVGPAKQAHSYGLLIYGSAAGYQSSRAQIELNGPSPQDSIAFVRFCDPGVTFPLDTYNNGIVTMYLPTSMFQPVLNILRTEKFIEVYFGPEQGFISTGNLLIGAGLPIHPTASARTSRKRKRVRSHRRPSSTGGAGIRA
jgi:hypothetical protein